MNEEASSNQGDGSDKKLSRRTFTELTALGIAAALSALGLDYIFNHRGYLGFRVGEEPTSPQNGGSGSGYPVTPPSTPLSTDDPPQTLKPKYVPEHEKPTKFPESAAEITSYVSNGMTFGYDAKQQELAGNKNWEKDNEVALAWLNAAAQVVIDSDYSDEYMEAFYRGKSEYLYDGCWAENEYWVIRNVPTDSQTFREI